MKIVWDEPKRLDALSRRGLDFQSITEAWLNEAVIVEAKMGRLQAIGLLDGKPISVIFKPLGREAVSIISMRAATRKERQVL